MNYDEDKALFEVQRTLAAVSHMLEKCSESNTIDDNEGDFYDWLSDILEECKEKVKWVRDSQTKAKMNNDQSNQG